MINLLRNLDFWGLSRLNCNWIKMKRIFKVDILITSMILALPISIYSGIFISILHNIDFISIKVFMGVLISYFYTLLLFNIILTVLNRFKFTSIFIFSIISVYFYLNFIMLSNMGYSIKIEHFQLIANTGISEFIAQSGVDIDEVIELFLYTLFIYIFSYFFILKIYDYFKDIKKSFSTLLILIVIILDTTISWYKISKDTNSIFNNTFSEAIIFRPNIAKYFLDKQKSFKLINKSRLDTSIKCSSSKQPPHIVIFLAESLRADMTTKEIMPNLNNLNGTLFKNHYSTSNATFFSLFSIMYGLFPTYYYDTIKKAKPTLLNLVDSLKYHKSIYNTLSLNYAGLNYFLNDKYFDKHYEKIGKSRTTLYLQDQEIVDEFKTNFTASKKPEFHLLLTNSTHHDYYFPKTEEFERFKPYPKRHISLLKTDGDEYKRLVFNKYKNSAYYLDSLVQQVVDTIKEKSQWNSTIFIFLGDHGEEFFEDGHFLHSNALNYYQTSASLFIHTPSNSKKLKLFKTTSHMDIVPTIISILKDNKVDVSQPNWLKGKNILSPLYIDRAVFSQQISTTRKIKVSIANQKNVFTPTKKETNSTNRLLIEEYIDDLLNY